MTWPQNLLHYYTTTDTHSFFIRLSFYLRIGWYCNLNITLPEQHTIYRVRLPFAGSKLRFELRLQKYGIKAN